MLKNNSGLLISPAAVLTNIDVSAGKDLKYGGVFSNVKIVFRLSIDS